jgi:hypothetical protein
MPPWSSVSLEIFQDTDKELSCLIRREVVELDFEIEPPEGGWIEPI